MLLNILRESIHDERFLRLLSNMMEAGYMEDWVYGKTLSGTPQGGILSPLLANIYMDKLDKFVEQQLLPKWNKGEVREFNMAYRKLQRSAGYYRKKGKMEKAKELMKEARELPSINTNDSSYRRLRYVRYADDYLLGFNGPREEAEQVKEEIRKFLLDELKLEQSEAKTLVTHARAEKAKFLNYEVHTLARDTYRGPDGRRAINGKIGLRVPQEVIERRIKPYTRNGKPIHRGERINDDDVSIIKAYQEEYRGIVNYWRMAYNLRDMGKLRWAMQLSLTKTLAAKHKAHSYASIREKYEAEEVIDGRKRKVLKAMANRPGKAPVVGIWGGITLAWNPEAALNDQPGRVWNNRTEIVQRLLADECEWCGSDQFVEVHHIRALKDLNVGRSRKLPEWKILMSARRRKTMVVCRECHMDIQYGLPMRNPPSGRGFMHEPKEWHKTQRKRTISRAV